MDIASQPVVSVVIPTYNGGERLLACLETLIAQTRLPDEIIVVDDASPEHTAALVVDKYSAVKTIRLARNSGFCRAANAGIRVARGDCIGLLNDDTEVAPEWLAELLAATTQMPGVGFFASKMLFFDRRDIVNSAGLFLRPDGISRDIGFGQRDGPDYAYPRAVFGASGGAALYRRALFEDVGLFDEDLVAYVEDTDLSLRAQLRGWGCCYVPTAVVYHRVGASFGFNSPRKVYYSSRNMLTVTIKGMPAPLLRRYAALIVAAQVYQVLYNAGRGRGWAALRGKAHALRDLPRTLWKRKAIQESARASTAHIAGLLTRV